MRPTRLAVSATALAGLVLSSLALAPSAGALEGCFVKNKSTGQTYTDFQDAIDDANSGNVLRLKGTCTGNFDVGTNLRVRGGSTNPATLDGDGTGTTLTVDESKTLKLAFVVITGGDTDQDGGGIDNAGTLRMKESDVSSNQAGGSGGGVLNESSGTLTMRNVTVDSNTAGLNGGGILNDGGTVTLRNAKLRRNGIATVAGPRISRGLSSLINNGGALYNGGGTMNVNDSTIGKQDDSNAANDGGGLFVASGQVNVDASTIHYNQADRYGGGIYEADAGTVYLNDTLITLNNAGNTGGGFFSECGATYSETGTTLVEGNTPNDQATIC
jgi:hypothetical protein